MYIQIIHVIIIFSVDFQYFLYSIVESAQSG